MNRSFFFWAVCLMLVTTVSWAEGSRGLKVVDSQGRAVAEFGAAYALVIGESAYRAGWPSLDGVKDDVKAVGRLLGGLGFSVTVIQDVDGKALSEGISHFLDTNGYDRDNRLVVYYAGHGATLKLGGEERDMGYLVPVDAPSYLKDEKGFKRTALPLQQFDTWARQIEARQVLFLFDSCFSGSIFSTNRALPGIIDYKVAQPVRQFITSGSADETVPDRSLFRRQLELGLGNREADANQDGYVSGSELGDYLQTTVVNYSSATQHPQYGKIRDNALDKGDFVFEVGRAAPWPVVQAGVPSPPTIGTVEVPTGSLKVKFLTSGNLTVDELPGQIIALPAQGSVPIDHLPVGRYHLTATFGDGVTVSREVEVGPGAMVAVEFRPPAPPGPPVYWGEVQIGAGVGIDLGGLGLNAQYRYRWGAIHTAVGLFPDVGISGVVPTLGIRAYPLDSWKEGPKDLLLETTRLFPSRGITDQWLGSMSFGYDWRFWPNGLGLTACLSIVFQSYMDNTERIYSLVPFPLGNLYLTWTF